MRSNQTIKTALAVTLALGATAAPAASAHAGQAGSAQSGQPGWVVRPNPDQQAAQLARAAAATSGPSTWVVRPNPDEQTPLSTPTTIVHVTAPSRGFHWGDAGIGAAAGFALSMLAVGLALVVSQRRARRSRQSAAIAT